MNRPPRVFFVNRFYRPDEPATAQLLTDLAEALAAEGRAVSVIASQPPGNIPAFEIHNGVEIHRVGGPRSNKRGLLAKALAYQSFARGALRLLAGTLHPSDTVVLMTDPPLLAVRAAKLARQRGARVVHWIQDVFPEIADAVGILPGASLFRFRRDRAWRNADACVVLGSDMEAFVRGRGVPPERITLCPNWAPLGLTPPAASTPSRLRLEWGLTGKFVVAYSGNLGRVHDLVPILSLAGELRTETDIVFLFIGDGAQRAMLEQRAARLGLGNVLFKPAQPRIRLAETLALADLHLITLLPGCEALVFPSKLYGIAAVGRPALFIGSPRSELAQIITRHGFGSAWSRNQMPAAANTIRELRSFRPRLDAQAQASARYGRDHARLEQALPRWRALLDSLSPLAG